MIRVLRRLNAATLLSTIVAIISVIVVIRRIVWWGVGGYWLGTDDTGCSIVVVRVVAQGICIWVVVVVLVASEWRGGPAGAAEWLKTAATATACVEAAASCQYVLMAGSMMHRA